MLKRATTLLMLLIVPMMAGDAFAQTDVTIRQINAIPQDQIDQLTSLGTALTAAEINPSECTGLIFDNTLCGTEVRFTAVVMSDPLNSGLSGVTDGLPSRVHVFVRDIAADSDGPLGHNTQIVDGSNLGMSSLIRGDVIEVVGAIDPFFTQNQVVPTSFTVVGSRDTATDPIFDPIIVTTADVNQDMGPDGAIQVNWANLSDLRSAYVQFQNATVLSRTIGDRPDYNVTTDAGTTSVSGYDTSLRYRNDRDGVYPSSFNVRSDDFVPPPSGARVNLSGFIVYTGVDASDPFLLAVPFGAVLAISPMADSDLVITESPPAVANISRPDTAPGLAGASVITAEVSADPTRSITSVSLVYFTSSDPTEFSVPSTGESNGVYTLEIPPALHGDFITYWVRATDNTGAITNSGELSLRSLVGGITSIAHIQETATGGVGSSPFFDMEVDMNITATVQYSQPDTRHLTLQDDASGAAWSGIVVRFPDDDSGLRVLNAGDVINITHAEIFERFGMTFMQDDGIVFTVISTGDSTIAPRVVTSDVIADRDLAEAYESVLVEIDDPLIMSTNADFPSGPFGEFTILSDESTLDAVRVDDEHSGVSYSSGDPATVFAVGERLDFVRGVVWYSFGNFKLEPGSFDDIGMVINTANEEDGLPASFTLDQNYPNPFNPSTQISYSIATSGQVLLEVFDVLGRQVATLVNTNQSVGTHTVTFDTTDLSSGLYIYRLSSGTKLQTKKMLLMK